MIATAGTLNHSVVYEAHDSSRCSTTSSTLETAMNTISASRRYRRVREAVLLTR